MGDVIAETRMREYLEEKGLMADFQQWNSGKDKALQAISEPEVTIEFTFGYRNRNHREDINITPWLSTAPIDEVRQLLAIEEDAEIDEDDDEHEFIEDIIEDLLDAEQREWLGRTCDTSMCLLDTRENIIKHLPQIRPHDYDQLIGPATVSSAKQPALI